MCVYLERAWSEWHAAATASSADAPAPSDGASSTGVVSGGASSPSSAIVRSTPVRAAAIAAPPAPASTRGNAEAGRRGRAVGRPAGWRAAAPSSNERGVDGALRAPTAATARPHIDGHAAR